MAASGENSDDLALRSGVEALSKIAIDLKVSIPVGKDSLSTVSYTHLTLPTNREV